VDEVVVAVDAEEVAVAVDAEEAVAAVDAEEAVAEEVAKNPPPKPINTQTQYATKNRSYTLGPVFCCPSTDALTSPDPFL